MGSMGDGPLGFSRSSSATSDRRARKFIGLPRRGGMKSSDARVFRTAGSLSKPEYCVQWIFPFDRSFSGKSLSLQRSFTPLAELTPFLREFSKSGTIRCRVIRWGNNGFNMQLRKEDNENWRATVGEVSREEGQIRLLVRVAVPPSRRQRQGVSSSPFHAEAK